MADRPSGMGVTRLARSAGREWLLKGTRNRTEAHRLLAATLTTVVRDVYPGCRGH